MEPVLSSVVSLSRAKRARVGRPAGAVMAAIEVDAAPAIGRARSLRGSLLHVGAARSASDSLASTLARQAAEWADAAAADTTTALAVLMEGVLSLPHLLPLIATLLALTCRRLQAADAAASRAFLVAVAARLHGHLALALRMQHPIHTRLLTRFLAACAAVGVFRADDVLAQLAALVDMAAAEEAERGAGAPERSPEGIFLLHTALSALLWGVNTPGGAAAAAGAGLNAPDTAVAAAATALLHRIGSLLGSDGGRRRGSSDVSDASGGDADALSDDDSDVAAADDDDAARRRRRRRRAARRSRSPAHRGDGPTASGGAGGAGDGEAPPIALTRERQHALTQWLDAPSHAIHGDDATGDAPLLSATLLAAAGASDTQHLWAAVRDAWALADAEAGSAGHSRRRELDALAVATLARPQDDVAVAAALFAAPAPSSAAAGEDDEVDIAAAAAAPVSGIIGARLVRVARVRAADAAAADATAAWQYGYVPGDEASPAYAHAPLSSAEAEQLAGGSRDRRGARGTDGEGDDLTMSTVGAEPVDAVAVLAEHVELQRALFAEVAPASRAFIKPSMHLFGLGGLSSSAAVMRLLGYTDATTASALALWVVRDLCHDVIACYYPFHADAANALATIPMGVHRSAMSGAAGTVGGSDLGGAALYDGGAAAADARAPTAPPPLPSLPAAVEATFCQLLWLPESPVPPTYYSLLIIDLIAASAAIERRPLAECLGTVATGLCARVAWKFLAVLDDALLPRMASWMAHHASNTQWAWLWAEWAGLAVTSPADAPSPHRRFLQHLLDETFALVGPWHYKRIVEEHMPQPLHAAGMVPPSITDAAFSSWLDAPAAAAASPPARATAAAPPAAALFEGGDLRNEERAVLEATAGGHAAAVAADHAHIIDAEGEALDAAAAAMGGDGTTGLAPPHIPDAARPSDDARGAAAVALDMMRAKAEAPALAARLPDAVGPQTQLLAITHALLAHGKANTRNVVTLLQRYRSLLADGAPATAGLAQRTATPPQHNYVGGDHAARLAGDSGADATATNSAVHGDDVRAHLLLSAVECVWHRAPSTMMTVAHALLDEKLVSGAQIAAFAVDPCVAFTPPSFGNVRPGARTGEVHHGDGRLVRRVLQLTTWALVRGTLERCEALAHAAGVEVALFRGARIYDGKEEEADEAVAVAKEGELTTAARAALHRFHEAVAAALGAMVAASRTLQFRRPRRASAATLRLWDEALRVTLSHMRDVGRRFMSVVRRPAVADALATRVEASTAVAIAPHGSGIVDLAGEVIRAIFVSPCPALLVPHPLLRDADVPVPDHSEEAGVDGAGF